MPVFIFDMDGTLTDTNHHWRSYGSYYLQSIGLPAPEDDLKRAYALGWQDYCTELIETYRLDTTPEMIWQWHLSRIPEYYRTSEIKRDALSFLYEAKAKGIRMAIATATPHELCDPLLKRLGLWEYFELVYTTAQWNTTKTKPDLYLQCCKDLGVKPQQAVVFEDAIYAIETTVKAGLYTVAIEDMTEMQPEKVKRLANQYLIHYADIDWSDLPE